jgi:hypothetical protein
MFCANVPDQRLVSYGAYTSTPSTAIPGSVYYDSGASCLKRFDGVSWQPIIGLSYTADLDPETQSLLEWAREKREAEQRLIQLCSEHPGLREAKERFDIMLALVSQEKSHE